MATVDHWNPDHASIRQLVSRLGSEGRALLEEILRLVGAEARGRLSELRLAVVLLAAAGCAFLVGLVTASAAAVALLARAMPVWAAALVVAAIVLGVGAAVAAVAFGRLRRMARPPEQTLETLKEGVRWLRPRSGS